MEQEGYAFQSVDDKKLGNTAGVLGLGFLLFLKKKETA